MHYEVIWDGTARTSRTLDVISHAPEDHARYWLTRCEVEAAEALTRTSHRPAYTTPQPCRNCGKPVTVARLNGGERTCYRCDKQRNADKVRIITEPLPCRTCETGKVVVSRARQGERRCRVCLGRAKPRPTRTANRVCSCGRTLTPARALHGRRTCHHCYYQQRKQRALEVTA